MTQPTPEQLLHEIELRIAAQRGRRTRGARNRAMILAFGILFIVVAAGALIFIGQQMLEEQHQRRVMNSATATAPNEK